MPITVEADTLYQIAAVIAGLGMATLSIRVQQHRGQPRGPGDDSWIPLVDWLLVAATVIAVVFVILPLLFANIDVDWQFIQASCAVSCILFLGYVFAMFRRSPRAKASWASRWRELTEPLPDDLLQSLRRKSKEDTAEAVEQVAFAGAGALIIVGLLAQQWALFGLGLGIGLLYYTVKRFMNSRRR